MFDDHPLAIGGTTQKRAMISYLMNHYENLPTNGILSAGSGMLAFIVSGVDPVYTGIILPIALFAVGKIVDVVVKVYIERRRR